MENIIYDGAMECGSGGCCPIAMRNTETGLITLTDLHKPENGAFTMTAQEWNALLAHAKPIDA